MFVTTAGRTNEQMIEKAMETANNLNVIYIPRQKKSIQRLQAEMNSDCIVVGKERLELFIRNNEHPFFFHPNSAMFRIKRLVKGELDPFAEACQLDNGMSFLDCTMGLGSDSIVASFLTGAKGIVTGIEGQKYMAYIIKEGLQTWDSTHPLINEAFRRIEVVHSDSLTFLKSLPDQSYDCVYFDPMFEETILESDGIKALGRIALHQDLTENIITEGLRVAKKRIVLKDHYKSSRFDRFGFQVFRRKTAKFHFGVLEK